MRNCPRCFEERALAFRGEAPEARGCAGCHGVWLSTAAAHRLIEGPFGSLAQLPAIAGGATLRCPECGEVLERRLVDDVEIDVCPRDGVWFDHAEVERVQAAARRPRRGEGLAAAAVIGTAVVADIATSIYAPGSRPGQQPATSDSGVAVDVALETVGEVSGAAIDVAASGAEVIGSAVVEGGALEAVGAGAEAVGSGALELLASLFEGIFS